MRESNLNENTNNVEAIYIVENNDFIEEKSPDNVVSIDQIVQEPINIERNQLFGHIQPSLNLIRDDNYSIIEFTDLNGNTVMVIVPRDTYSAIISASKKYLAIIYESPYSAMTFAIIEIADSNVLLDRDFHIDRDDFFWNGELITIRKTVSAGSGYRIFNVYEFNHGIITFIEQKSGPHHSDTIIDPFSTRYIFDENINIDDVLESLKWLSDGTVRLSWIVSAEMLNLYQNSNIFNRDYSEEAINEFIINLNILFEYFVREDKALFMIHEKINLFIILLDYLLNEGIIDIEYRNEIIRKYLNMLGIFETTVYWLFE